MPESAGSVTLLTADSIYRQRLVIGEGGKQYLAVVLDLFSRFIVGSAVSACNDRHLTLKALKMALKRWRPDIGLLHRSGLISTPRTASADAIRKRIEGDMKSA